MGFELFAGSVGVVAAIAGVAGYSPVLMAAIATIAIGFALLAQGGTLAARWRNATHISGTERTEAIGIGSEVLGGLAGLALGTLALLRYAPLVVLPVAAIVVGAALLFGGPAQPQIADAAPRSTRRYRVTRDAMRTSSSVMVMAGVAGIVLGVLGLARGSDVLLLSLIATLAIAASLVVVAVRLEAATDREPATAARDR